MKLTMWRVLVVLNTYTKFFTDVKQLHIRPQVSKVSCLMVFERCHFWPSVKSFKVFFTQKILLNSYLRQSEIQAHLILLSSFASSSSSDVTLSRFRPQNGKVILIGFQIQPVLAFFSNLDLCVFRVVFQQIGQCVEWRFSSKSLFSLLVRLTRSSDASPSPFRFWNRKLYLIDFSKMLLSFGPRLNPHTYNSRVEFF